MENHQNIKELFTKYLDKSISREEYESLLIYFGKEDNETELRQLVLRSLEEDSEISDSNELNQIVDSVEQKLRQKLQQPRRLKFRRYLPYAAIIIAALLGGGYLLLHRLEPEANTEVIADVKPGHSAATLTLANGKRIPLNNISAGSIATEQGIEITKGRDGEVVYNSKSPKVGGSINQNTISTENGETYQIVLSDGTRVWLNAATTLQFSANLERDGKRRVNLVAGEAYFEVKKDKKHPFIVQTATQEVEVLGTHFNINNYTDERYTTTTLEEGAVKVTATKDTKQISATLKPGEQSLSANGSINLRNADLQSVLAWKEGKMYFKDAPLDEVLKQVSRWYNIKIEYQGEVGNETFTGGIKRTSNLSAILRILELSNLKYKLIKKNNITSLIVR